MLRANTRTIDERHNRFASKYRKHWMMDDKERRARVYTLRSNSRRSTYILILRLSVGGFISRGLKLNLVTTEYDFLFKYPVKYSNIQ